MAYKLYIEDIENHPSIFWLAENETFKPLYSDETTYVIGDKVQVFVGNSFSIYISKVVDNLDNDPLTSPDEWKSILSTYIESIDYIVDLNTYSKLLPLDYIQLRTELISRYTTFSTLTNTQKDIIGCYKALNGTTTDTDIVTHYALVHFGLDFENDDALTQLTKLLQAKKRYTDEIGVHIKMAAPLMSVRSDSPKISSICMYYLEDEIQMNNLMDATIDLDTMLRRRALLGTEYGDMIDGIMDYFESTGSYIGDGLEIYTLDPNVVAIFPGGNEPEQIVNARAQMILELKDVIINGNI